MALPSCGSQSTKEKEFTNNYLWCQLENVLIKKWVCPGHSLVMQW